MGNVNMEARQIHYRGGNKQMSVADELDSLKSGFTNLDNEVNGDATVYPYADVITIDDAVPSNLADCSVKIEPVQSGSGDPSPTNVRPITGHTEVTVTVTDDAESPTVTKTYTIALGDTIYGGTVDFDSGVMSITYRILSLSDTYTYTTPSYPSAGGLGFAGWENTGAKLDGNGLCNLCAVDNTGAWTSTIPVVQISNQVAGRVRFYCDAADDAELVSKYGDIVICCELATPTTIQLTPQQIQLLKGTNTITASTGQISVTTNGVSGAIGAVQEQVNELVADLAEKLPTAPTTDGTYNLHVTVADGTPAYSWVSGS